MIATLTFTRDITDHGKYNIGDPRTPCAISACIDIRLSVFVETADIDKIYEDLMQQALRHGHEESMWEGGPSRWENLYILWWIYLILVHVLLIFKYKHII